MTNKMTIRQEVGVHVSKLLKLYEAQRAARSLLHECEMELIDMPRAIGDRRIFGSLSAMRGLLSLDDLFKHPEIKYKMSLLGRISDEDDAIVSAVVSANPESELRLELDAIADSYRCERERCSLEETS